MAGNAAALARARAEKFEEWFKDRRWRIMDEVTGEREVQFPAVSAPGLDLRDDAEGTIILTFRQGHFTIRPPGRYKTPLGQTGRTGILIAEIDAAGQDTGVVAAFGVSALRRAQDTYGLIQGLA